VNKHESLFFKLAVGFFLSSFISGFVAAYLNDFHPQLDGFQALFTLKAVVGSVASFLFFLAYSESR